MKDTGRSDAAQVGYSRYSARMQRYYPITEATSLIIGKLNVSISDQLKALLETKHIYQKVKVDAAAVFSAFEDNIYGDDREIFHNMRDACLEGVSLTLSDRELFVEDKSQGRSPMLMLLLRSMKLFCAECDSKEAFRPVWWSDATNELRKPAGRERIVGNLPIDTQIFTLLYQCQRCTGIPHAFLVRRSGWELYLDGRSPFEDVEIPSFVPKAERRLYRDALIASHGGKTLAALFYLRTFIEQFARRQTRLPGRLTGDELMAAYGALLPEQQRNHMPSLKEWYDRLSEALHSAREDTELFTQALESIDNHFEFRRLFRIADAS